MGGKSIFQRPLYPVMVLTDFLLNLTCTFSPGAAQPQIINFVSLCSTIPSLTRTGSLTFACKNSEIIKSSRQIIKSWWIGFFISVVIVKFKYDN